ncbi:cytochrome P450 [Kitasatospora sp. NPDC088346]|uniref:cytochrome P450 family protein n=1 Tax=Kitasatospora sp. NPDC088346 TaxID=3364073 RepID=UPI0037F658C2
MPAAEPPVVLDAAFLADPQASYTALLRRGPVHRAVAPDGAPVWLVTGYREVRAAAADPRLSLNKRHARTKGRAGDSLPPELDSHLLNSDAPDHTRLRGLVNSAFGPRRVRILRDQVQRTADGLLDRLAGRRSADLVADLAEPLSMAVICDLLGIPEGDRVDFRTWTDTLLSPDPDAAHRSRAAMRSMRGFLAGLIAAKRTAPADDVLSELIAARDGGERLGEDELLAMAFLLLFGGYHNSAATLAATVLALLTHPVRAAELRGGRLTVGQVTEEVLRRESPAMLSVRRFALTEVEIAGAVIGPGERVWLCWASANRDPAAFEKPEVFDPGRAERSHLAFGHGAHRCVGAALARLENEIAVTTLLRRFPDLALGEVPETLPRAASPRSRALLALPVTLRRDRP